jgi:hypothetical protein
MAAKCSLAKAALIGGAILLIPGFLAFFVIGKVCSMLRSLAGALGPKLGIGDVLGAVLLDLGVIAAVLLGCFLAGWVARRVERDQSGAKANERPSAVATWGLAKTDRQLPSRDP